MSTFRVEWVIDLDADDPCAAVLEALDIHRNRDSIATVFTVRERGGCVEWVIDAERVSESCRCGNGDGEWGDCADRTENRRDCGDDD